MENNINEVINKLHEEVIKKMKKEEDDEEKYDYKKEAEKIKRERGFLSKDFYDSYTNEIEGKLTWLSLHEFQRAINKALDQVEEFKKKYSNPNLDLGAWYNYCLETIVEKFESTEPYFPTNEDRKAYYYNIID